MTRSLLIPFVLCIFTVHSFADNEASPDQLKKTCKSGDMKSCNDLGTLFLEGENIEQDYLMAREFFSQACEGGRETQ